MCMHAWVSECVCVSVCVLACVCVSTIVQVDFLSGVLFCFAVQLQGGLDILCSRVFFFVLRHYDGCVGHTLPCHCQVATEEKV